jgi:hypothetical protein
MGIPKLEQMKRASIVLIAGLILLMTSVVVFAVFIHKSASLAETLPDISVKDVVKYSLNKFSDTDNASIQESKKRIVYDMAIIFFGIISGIVLLINGILTLIGGAIMWICDRGKK